jgi:hypothetical protein
MLSGYSEPLSWNKLSLAPLWLKDKFLYLINREKENAKAGRGGHIIAKINSLCDKDVIEALYEAAAEGVKNLYTVTVQRNVNLRTGEVIQRLSDGRYLRITSDGTDKKTPASAGLDMIQMSAEEIGGLPDG